VARDIRTPRWPWCPRVVPGSPASAHARPRAPRRDRAGGAVEPAFGHVPDGTRSHTRAVSHSPKPPPWTSAGTRYIDDALAERPIVPARGGAHLAPAPDPLRARAGSIRRGGSGSRRRSGGATRSAGSRSRREVDPP